jgi:DNA polymerase III alpha subunit (gram-positive type)
MPFKSEAQRKWMYANKPGMAERWQAHTPKNKRLPKKVTASMNKYSEIDQMLGEAKQRHEAQRSAQEEQRQQDVHEQQLRFNEDKHQINLQQLSLQLEQSQQKFKLQQEQEQQRAQEDAGMREQEMQSKQEQLGAKKEEMHRKQQEQQAAMADKQRKRDEAQAKQQQQQQEQQQQQNQMKQQSDVSHQHNWRQNLMSKSGAFDVNGRPLIDQSAIPSLVLGTGMGGAAAHYMFPSELAEGYRAQARAITPQAAAESLAAAKAGKLDTSMLKTVSDTTGTGAQSRFKAPAHVRKQYFLNRALQSNAKRLVGGAGAGLLAGLLIHKAMQL